MTSASPSPKSPEVSEKSKKYDRQLRLWGDHGQSKLEKSHVCLINATATGTEILKSLILPGCGSFVIVDGHKVTQADIGSNFFLDADSLNRSRGDCAVRLLSELNPDVTGDFIDEHPEHLLTNNPSYFTKFSIVIACQLGEGVLINLSKLLWEHKVPFVNVQTTGFLGWVRVQLNEHTIIESHPDPLKLDLRLDKPFPELITHMDSIKVGEMDHKNAIKTPWLVWLHKALQSYLQDCHNGNADSPHPGRYPKTYGQKGEFKNHLKEYFQNNGLNSEDDAYKECVNAVNTAVAETCVPKEVEPIINDNNTSRPESKFWFLCAALKEFVKDKDGQLPVSGVLPDMTADSEKYISLQNVYRGKAEKDANEVFDKVCQLIRQSGKQGMDVTLDDVRLFCKESHNLRIIRGYPIFEELRSSPSTILSQLGGNMEDCNQELMFYIILRGYIRFENENKRYPGVDGVEPDMSSFKATVTKLLNEWNTSVVPMDDCIHEICRYGGAEIHSVAAFLGGCVAQEAIKIVTSQYIPLDNTFIYNAVTSTSLSFKLEANP